ncbi:MAG: hypothetical protein QM757_16110 [Paludibaculum sp.]
MPQSPVLCAILGFLSTVLLCPGLNAEGAGAILRAVSARYTSATDYTLRLRTKSGTASFDITLAARRPHQCMARQTARGPDPFELLLITDATTVWGYQPHRKLYTRFGPGPGDERTELERLHHLYFGRFQFLDRLAARASVVGTGSVQSGGQRVRCLRIRIEPTGGSDAEELWIDTARHLVLKSVARGKRPLPETGDLVTTAVWRECNLDRSVDPGILSFTPPPGARRTNTLEFR